MAEKLTKALAYEITADWHDAQAFAFRTMSEDEPRIDKLMRERAADALKHHAGSAAALRIASANLRRAALEASDEH